ncbi:MAG: hypothetical protein R3E08_04060 [Thiotrichaceae bacterium]
MPKISMRVKSSDELGVKALDDYAVGVTLALIQWVTFHHWLEFGLIAATEKIIEQYKEKWTQPENIQSSGAYQLTKWEKIASSF